MGHFIKKVQTIEEYHNRIVPTEESSYEYWDYRTEETQFPNICYVAEGNQVKYKSNTPLIVDICYVVYGWSNSDYDLPQSIDINILAGEYSSDDDIIQIQNYGDYVAIKDYIDKVEYITQTNGQDEILNNFYNASIEISNPQEGNEERVYIRYYLKRPTVYNIIDGASSSASQTWGYFTHIDLARIEVKSGCKTIQNYIFNNTISGATKYKTQVILYDIVPPIDSTYFMVLGTATVIYVPKVAETIYKENDWYAEAANVIQGYELNEFPENKTFSILVDFSLGSLTLEELDSNEEDNSGDNSEGNIPLTPVTPPSPTP